MKNAFPSLKLGAFTIRLATILFLTAYTCLLASQSDGIDTNYDSPIVDANYPGGNIIVERIEGDTVFLHQDLRDTSGWWFYWNFRVRGAAGRTLTFKFTDGNPIGTLGPALSGDQGRSWTWLGTDSVRDASS